MIYLTAIFVPPLYFLIKKNWLAFIVTGFLFFISLVLCMTVFLIPAALVLWFLCSICAVWNVRRHLMYEHASIIAEKMAETMRQQQSTPVPPRL